MSDATAAAAAAAPAAAPQAGAETWVPCLVLSHAWALFFIVKALSVLNPQLWRRAKKRMLRAVGWPARADAPSLPRMASADLWREHLAACRVAEPLTLEWEGLGCEYNTAHGVRTVLKDVSGAARPCELLALMGPSGAGKSTLLDILAARKSVGRLAGVVTVNGAPRGADYEDNFQPAMTVAETCELHAALALPRGTPRAQAAARVEEVLAAMGMLHARNTLVGGVLPGGLSLRGLSGGERRRVSVAIGILAAPGILFLDEPTSGLDSCSALAVVEHLRDRARDSGLTVVASIHQPRAAVWACFDSCAVLSGGLGLYHGRTDEVVGWFTALGYGPWDSTAHGAASDWVMDLVNVGFAKSEVQGLQGRTIETRDDLQAAAEAFSDHYGRTQRKLHSQEGAFSAATVAAAAGRRAERPAAGAAAAASVAAASLHRSSSGSGSKRGSRGPSGGGGECVGSSSALAAATASPRHGWRRHAPPHAGSPRDGGRAVVVVERASASGSSGSEGASDAAGAGALGAGGARLAKRPTFYTQFRALLRREMLATMRNPADVAGRMLLFAWVGVFCGLVFWRLGAGLDGLRGRVNLLFVESLQFMLLPYVYMSLYAADRRHFTADMSARLYTPGPYYAAKTLAVLPFALGNVLLSGYIIYGMAGLRLTARAAAVNGAASALLYLVAQQVQALAAILMPNEDASFLLTIAYTTVNLYLSNFVIRFADMANGWLAPLRYVSAVNFAYAALLKAEFGGADMGCAGGLPPDMLAATQALLPDNPTVHGTMFTRMVGRPGAGCRMELDAVLSYFGIGAPAAVYLAALLAHLVFMHAATYCGLLRLARRERR
ncbi:MAG: hypothetical protein J3K34DRAFT_521019 [Monoraphidium minutum]|nr:MAG: hypothetical protein J3K34DRAFT_521019 [Monoraphidium minutum]